MLFEAGEYMWIGCEAKMTLCMKVVRIDPFSFQEKGIRIQGEEENRNHCYLFMIVCICGKATSPHHSLK